MARIFVISDQHGIAVPSPAGFDISINLGDFIDGFIDNPQLHTESIAAARQYDYVVPGNHEWIVLGRARRAIQRRADKLLSEEDVAWLARLCAQPEQHLEIEGCRIRMSHYLQVDRRYIASAPLPKPFESDAVREQAQLGYKVVLFGHNHRREHLIIDGCHAVNPGHGERGEYAVVSLDGGSVKVEFGSLKV